MKFEPLKAWSPSALKDYERCSRKAQYERGQKLCTFCFEGSVRGRPATCDRCRREKPADAPALVKGTKIHEDIELYITRKTKTLEKFIQKQPTIKTLINDLRAGYAKRTVRVELELAFTKKWELTDWFGKDVYARFKLDVLQLVSPTESLVIDWKSGTPHPESYDDALNGYAVAALSAGFGKRTEARLAYVEHDVVVDSDAGTLTLAQLPKAQKALDKRAARMLSDTKFTPRPGVHCRWCPYSANRIGPCPY